MSSIITTEITQEDAKRDIEYCLGNAWTKRVISANYFLIPSRFRSITCLWWNTWYFI